MYRITENYDDYMELSNFLNRNGLEVTTSVKRPENVLKSWACFDVVSKELIAGAILEKRKGKFVIAGVAVVEQYRGQHIGTVLMHNMETEIYRLGGEKAWLAAKVPGFYLREGWIPVPIENAPDIFACSTCEKFGKECFPMIMRKNLKV